MPGNWLKLDYVCLIEICILSAVKGLINHHWWQKYREFRIKKHCNRVIHVSTSTRAGWTRHTIIDGLYTIIRTWINIKIVSNVLNWGRGKFSNILGAKSQFQLLFFQKWSWQNFCIHWEAWCVISFSFNQRMTSHNRGNLFRV